MCTFDIIVDHNEPETIKEMILAVGLKAKFDSLYDYAAGDFVVGVYTVERKTREDVRSSITDGRIFRQSSDMVETAKKAGLRPLILVEGSRYKFDRNTVGTNYYIERAKWENRTNAVLNSITTQLGIPIVYTSSMKKTVEYLKKLAFANGGSTDASIHAVRHKAGIKKKSLDIQQRFVLESFPNIGAKKSDKMLIMDGTLANSLIRIIDFDIYVSEQKRVMGKKTREEITKLLHHKYKRGE